MGISDDRGTDQNEDPGADDGADTETGEIPRCQGLFQSMRRVVGVGQDLFDGLGAKQSIDHQSMHVIGRGGWGRRNRLMIHDDSSIAVAKGGPSPAAGPCRVVGQYNDLGQARET